MTENEIAEHAETSRGVKLSRRGFVTGAAALCALGASGLAGCAPSGSAGGSGLTFADTVAWDAEFDVVVIGFGGGGGLAAISAAEEGAQVLLCDKAEEGHEGGNTRYCHQDVLDYGTYEDGIKYFKAEAGSYDTITDEIIDFVVKGSMENSEWFASLGMKPLKKINPVGEYPELDGCQEVYTCQIDDDSISNGKTFWESVRKAVLDRSDKIEVWLSSPGEHLIQDPVSKAVIGAVISREGKKLNVRAKNGVILACGGFENNPEMVELFLQRPYMYPLGSLYNTGDGIKMASEVGAQLWHTAAVEGPWLTVKPEGMVQPYFNAMFNNIFKTGGSIYVGKDGNRFIPEWGFHRHGHLSYAGTFYSQISPAEMWAVFDETARLGGTYVDLFSDDLSVEIENGTVIKAESLEELEEAIGINKDFYQIKLDRETAGPSLAFADNSFKEAGLVNTVRRFNEYCAEGYDPEFQRKPETLHPIETPPYYAIKIEPAMVNTQGGPKRNIECEVLDAFDQPIPHLYSVGELGSFYGGAYTGGGNLAENGFCGRVAGRNAAAEKEALPPLDFKEAESKVQTLGSNVVADYTQGVDVASGESLGVALGLGGELVVKVKHSGNTIEPVEVVREKETGGIGSRAIETIPQRIVEENSTDVDVVTGATVSSKAIMLAVSRALEN